MIYLDNNATTRLHPAARAAMEPFLAEEYANPSSLHSPGKRARTAVELAREQLAAAIDARPSEIIFTSGGSESTATALHAALRHLGPDTVLVTSTVEHSATERACAVHESLGHRRILVSVNHDGHPDLDRLERILEKNRPALVSFLWANNETGFVYPVRDIAARCQTHGAVLHLDAVQAIGKIPVSVRDLPVHFLSLSGHKFHGPKGTGALFARATFPFTPLIPGGGQEQGRRSGTENVPGIVGLGAAAACISLPAMDAVARLRDRLEQEALRLFPATRRNGAAEPRLPNTANLAFPGLDAEALLIVLDHLGVCASPGSACGSSAGNASAVLTAMGFDAARVKSSVRFSLSRFTTEDEIGTATLALGRAVERIAAARPAGPPVLRRE